MKNGINLHDMMRFSFKDEILERENEYFCNNCERKSSRTIKKIKIKKLPNFVIVTINRFQFNLKLMKKIKLHYKVEIDFEFAFNPDLLEE